MAQRTEVGEAEIPKRWPGASVHKPIECSSQRTEMMNLLGSEAIVPGAVSVIIATYNVREGVAETLVSLKEQLYSPLEVLVVDGESTDGTVDVLRARESDLSYWSSGPDRGIYDAWNKALVHATGEWVMFLGAGDVLPHPCVVGQLVVEANAALRHNVRLVYGRLLRLDKRGFPADLWGRPWDLERKRFLGGVMRIPHTGMLHHHSLFHEYGLFDASMRVAGDYEFLLRELRTRPAWFCPTILGVIMPRGGTSDRLENRFASLAEVQRARMRHLKRMPSMRLIRAYFLNAAALTLQAILPRRFFEWLQHVWRGRPWRAVG